ncbi:MAG: hypothetical protein JXB35_15935 [Anaerolineae bacterium]|nr:hypothetical protein [Anaerolineae bacterium]
MDRQTRIMVGMLVPLFLVLGVLLVIGGMILLDTGGAPDRPASPTPTSWSLPEPGLDTPSPAPSATPPSSSPPVGAPPEPATLIYGPKGLAGRGVFGLVDHDAWHDDSVGETYVADARLARVVGCPTDAYLFGQGNGYDKILLAAEADFVAGMRGRVWLVYDEPDSARSDLRGEPCGQQSLRDGGPPVRDDPANAALRYGEVYDWITSRDPYARVFAGGFLNLASPATGAWWTTFLDTLGEDIYKVEGVHVHIYGRWTVECQTPWCIPEMTGALNGWYERQHLGQGMGSRPLWITEIGAAPFCDDYRAQSLDATYPLLRDNVMEPLSWWFARDSNWAGHFPGVPDNPGYEAIFWFLPFSTNEAEQAAWGCTFLEASTGDFTPLGEYWQRYDVTPR